MAEKNIRITSGADGIQKIERSKLQRKVQIAQDDGSSSIKSIVMLVIIIVLVAITGAYVVKNLQSTNSGDGNVTPDAAAPTTEPINSPAVIGEAVEQDIFDEYKVALKTYTNEDTSITGNEDAQFELQDFATQPFESFYRLTFDFATKQETKNAEDIQQEEKSEEVAENVQGAATGSGSQVVTQPLMDSENVPPATIVYKNKEEGFEEIEITFSNIMNDNAAVTNVFGTQNMFKIEGSSVAELSYDPIDDEGNFKFNIALNDFVDYYVQIVDNLIILDIEEATVRETAGSGSDVSPAPAASVSPMASPLASPGASIPVTVIPTVTPNASLMPSPTNSPATSGAFTVKIEPKNITSTTKARISGYTFDDTSDKFIYHLKLAGSEVPKVSARSTGNNTVEVKIEEISYDGLTKDGKAFTNFSAKGVKDIVTMNATFGGTTSNYVFTLTSNKNYDVKLESIEGENRLVIEIDH